MKLWSVNSDRGFSKFNEKTTITVTTGLPTAYFEAFMKDQLKSVVKVQKKHKECNQANRKMGIVLWLQHLERGRKRV